jgi:DNA helicase-2/ATP-dependent DNA helicase PcrA
LFSKEPEILARYQKQFRYILVDEYQDSNVVQYLWLRLLAQAHRNICVVGDDDQSIYGWRGAEVENILRFEHDFPGAKVIRLEQNYRSTPHILAAASGLIAQNEGRLGKTLWTDVAEGEKVKLTAAWDGEEEARKIGDEIEDLQRKGVSLNDIAILVRAGFQTREFEERFITLGLRYRVIGGPRFYERQEIRDALAYLRLVNQPDDGLAFERIVNVPKRGLGDATLKQVNDAARALNVSLPEAARQIVETDELKPAPRRTLGQLIRDLENWRKLAETTPHAELAQIVLDESGYTAMWQNDKSIEAPGRLENLKELIHALEEFDSLGGFLEHVSLVMENAAAGDGEMITIMTLHGAKGLEFDIVFLPGWEEGLFPSQRSLDENGVKGLEEERRLAYVGITRARKRALISYAANRRVHNMWQNALPSRFIAELPKAHIEREDDQLWRPSERYMGPQSGWGRQPLREGFGRRGGTLIDLSAEAVVQTGTGRYPSGARIFHQKFGYGKVLHSEGDKLEIAFDKAGVKKVMASFVMPAEQAG